MFKVNLSDWCCCEDKAEGPITVTAPYRTSHQCRWRCWSGPVCVVGRVSAISHICHNYCLYCLLSIYKLHNVAPHQARVASRAGLSFITGSVWVLMAAKCKCVSAPARQEHRATNYTGYLRPASPVRGQTIITDISYSRQVSSHQDPPQYLIAITRFNVPSAASLPTVLSSNSSRY